MKTIILNSSNYVAGSQNQFQYTFPVSTKFPVGSQVAVASLAIYNSTFNIQASRGNNTITISWLGTLYSLTFSDGYYAASDINYAIQYFCIQNNLYMTASSGSTNVYFVEIVQNAVRYSLQLNCYAIPTVAQATALGYALPAGASWSLPATAATPLVSFNAVFGALIGQPQGTFPTVAQATNYSIISTITPIISPVNSYILTCSLINSNLSIPSDVFYTIPLSAALGGLVSANPSQFTFNNIADNVYNNFTIKFYDQLFNKLQMNDIEIVLALVIREPTEK